MEGDASLWKRFSHAVLVSLPPTTPNVGRVGVAFSPNGRFVAVCEVAPSGRHGVSIYEVPSGRLLRNLTGHGDIVTSVAFHPDGKHLATGSEDQTVRVWDTEKWETIVTLHEGGAVLGLTYSPDGSRLLSACDDQTVKVWSPSGAALRTLKVSDRGGIVGTAFSPDGRQLSVSSAVGIGVFEVSNGKELFRLTEGSTYCRPAWNSDGSLLGPAKGPGLWDVTTNPTVRLLPKPSASADSTFGVGAAFSRNGRYFATVLGLGAVDMWDITANQWVRPVKNVGRFMWPVTVAFHPEGRHLAVGCWSDRCWVPGTLEVWDITSGRKAFQLTGFRNSVLCVAYSPDGRLLAAGTAQPAGPVGLKFPGEVRVWDSSTGKEVYNLRGHLDGVYSIGFSPDGNRLISASTQRRGNDLPGEVRVWDMATGQQVFSWVGEHGDALATVFSPCGRFIATSRVDGAITIFDGTPAVETPRFQRLPDEH